MTKAEEYRIGARTLLEQYRRMDDVIERRKLWKRGQELILKAQAEEAKQNTLDPTPTTPYN